MVIHQLARKPLLLFVFLALTFADMPSKGLPKDTWIEVESANFKVVSNAGENEAKKIADQFEQFREVFHNSFPKFRVDLGRPLVIFAVKNEDTLKILLPEFWEVKGRTHPAGVFMPGETRHYVAVRTDIEGDNPYEVVYHEYTHAIMNLNFQGLPIWLGEGLAEFFGNSTIHDKEVEIGKISSYHLQVLKGSRLIPIEVLMQADARSPYYNEQNRASVFYAESWTIVHYLLMDPEARKRQLLNTFLSAWDSSGNQVAAAQQTFGDLKKFGSAMEAYARQSTFYVGHIRTAVRGDWKSYAARPLSPAEVSAEEGLFYIQTRRPKEAKARLDDALAADQNVALAHEGRGLLAYEGQDYGAAQKEFARAMELNPAGYVSYFYEAQSRLRSGHTAYEELPEISGLFQNALERNPQFAPAYAALSGFYSMHPETRDKALAMGKKAIELEPGNLNYETSFGYVLLNVGRTRDAKILAARIQAVARTPQEQQMASQFAEVIALRENAQRWTSPPAVQTVRPSTGGKTIEEDVDKSETSAPSVSSSSSTTVGAASGSTDDLPRHVVLGPEYHLEGKVVAAECLSNGEVKATLSINTVLMKFHAADRKSIEVTRAGKPDGTDKQPCAGWKGQKAKVTFHSSSTADYDGELLAIYFF